METKWKKGLHGLANVARDTIWSPDTHDPPMHKHAFLCCSRINDLRFLNRNRQRNQRYNELKKFCSTAASFTIYHSTRQKIMSSFPFKHRAETWNYQISVKNSTIPWLWISVINLENLFPCRSSLLDFRPPGNIYVLRKKWGVLCFLTVAPCPLDTVERPGQGGKKKDEGCRTGTVATISETPNGGNREYGYSTLEDTRTPIS